jgi:isopenicillin N synthase-like dioxygenase
MNYSRPRETTSAFINDVHEDGHLFTLTCATSPGLEVKTQSGAFADLLATPSRPVILPGEIAYLLSGGRIKPLYHRVRPDRGCNERVSLQYFCDIDPGACEPWACTVINRNVDIGALILTNPARFGLSGWSST